jgi:hypothetical protein
MALPPGEGAGLLAFDPAPPAGTRTWQMPRLAVGDCFVLLRGGRQRIELRVADCDEDGYTIVDASGKVLRRGLDLANIGEFDPATGTGVHLLTPPDVRYHWPLWVGKRWRCAFVDRTVGRSAVPIEAEYLVEALDRIETAAGSFPALRIVRRSRRSDGDSYLERVAFTWYSPEVGHEVRQVFGDTSVELVDWQPVAAQQVDGVPKR